MKHVKYLHKRLDGVSNWLMLLPLALCGVWFYVLEQTILRPEHYMYTPFDDLIPFVPGFVVPYVLWYLYVAGTAVFFFFQSRDAFRRIAIYLSAGMCVACVVFTLLPNGQHLRPYALGTDICSQLVMHLYQNDTPFNSAPSIHVIYSIGTTCAILTYNRNAGRVRYAIISILTGITTVAICLSTLFIKQHSVIDFVGGVVVGVLLYFFIYTDKHMARAKGYASVRA